MKLSTLENISKTWSRFTKGSVNRQIFGAALTVATGTAFVKVISVMKELFVAWKFGIGDELDAFFIALVVPSFIINVIAGSFHAAFIPSYIQARERDGKKVAQKLFSGVTIWAAVLLAIITIFMIITAPLYLPLIAGGFERQKLDLTFRLLYAIAPLILLDGIIVVWGAALNAGERFALAALSPMLTPAITIVLLLSLNWGIFTLVAGLNCGAVLEIIFLGCVLQRQGISLLPRWYGFDTYLKQVTKQYLPTVAGSFLMCSAGVVDQSMAAMLSPGSVAALNYGNRLIALPITLTTTALNTAVTPYFSKMVAHHNWIGVRRTLKHYLLLIFVFTIPLMGALIIFSEPIVRLMFQRGSFTDTDTQLVAEIQRYFALQIPFYVAAVFIVKLITSIQRNQILMWGSGLNLIVNITANFIFMHFLGIKGIALSTSCVYLISFSFLLLFALRYLNSIETNQP